MVPEGSLLCSHDPTKSEALCNILSQIIFFFYGEKLLGSHSLRRWTTLCRLSATTYSIHSRLRSISGGRLLHPQLEDASCHGSTFSSYSMTHYMVIVTQARITQSVQRVGYGLDDRGSNSGRCNDVIFSLRHRVQSSCGASPLPIQWLSRVIPEKKWSGREVDHSPPFPNTSSWHCA
jgi:hypothetical protein